MTAHDRAERALARALRDHDRDHDFAPLDPEGLKVGLSTDGGQAVGARNAGPGRTEDGLSARRRRRGPWVGLVAAALVLVLAVPFGASLLSLFSAASSAPSFEARPANAPAAGGAAPADQAAGGPPAAAEPATADDLPEPRPGWRWESMLDAAVQVPVGWGHDFAPGSDWCAEPGYQRPAAPFVDRNPLGRATRDILCDEAVPDDLRQTHLTWRRVQPGDTDTAVAVDAAGEWLRVNRVVGSAYLTVELPGAQIDLADEILASAEVIAFDARGCRTTSPAGPPDLGAVADLTTVSEVVVCQYGGAEQPNLVGSYALTGEQAQGGLDAVLEAPEATDPPHPTCADTGNWLVLRFDGTREVRLNMDACSAFVLDDGVTRRTPTRATCGDLLVGPLWLATLDEATDVCRPVR